MTLPSQSTEPVNGLTKYKVTTLETDGVEIKKTLEAIEKRLHDIEISLARLEERLNLFQLAQGTFTVIVGAIAAIIGKKQ